MQITKAVILAAGSGERLKPITKVIPKEMFPIGNKPVLDYLIEEGLKAGIKEFLILVNKNKQCIKDYYKDQPNIKVKIVGKTKGSADTLLAAKKFIGSDDFLVMLGDVLTDQAAADLIKTYKRFSSNILGISEVDHKDVIKYGMVVSNDQTLLVDYIIEKPDLSEAISDWVSIGRYIFKADIFRYIKNQSLGYNNELQISDAVRELVNHDKVYITKVNKFFDVGTVEGFQTAINKHK